MNKGEKMKILAIVVTYNFLPWMDRCLSSLQAADEPIDTLVIDNASTDGTPAAVRSHYPKVRLIENRENMGFGRANNLGMQLALAEGYDAVLLLNQDAWIGPDMLSRLVTALRHPGNSRFGILSPMHLTGRGDRPDPGFARYAGVTSKDEGLFGDVVEVPFINAAVWLLPADVLRRVGFFSPLFFLYGEDLNYVHRLHWHGFRLGWVPGAYACHDREDRVVTRAARLRADRVWLLAAYANINDALPVAFAKSVGGALLKALGRLRHGEVAACADYLRMSVDMLAHTAKVVRERRRTRQVPANSERETDKKKIK